MIKEELIKRSPFRILERSIHNGLGKGNIGCIGAPKGVGKTACLVHLATDRLIQGKNVIHVSFSPDTSHIIAWYEDIFQEIAKRCNLEGAMDIHDEIVRYRIIMNFQQEGVSALQVRKSVSSIIGNTGFKTELVVVDGYDFSKSDSNEFHIFKEMAEEFQLEIWFSVTLQPEEKVFEKPGIPQIFKEYMNDTAIIILLQPHNDHVRLTLIKDHDIFPNSDLNLRLDPQILLIADEK